MSDALSCETNRVYLSRSMRCLILVVLSPVLCLCSVTAFIIAGPIFFWRCCCFARGWKAIMALYDAKNNKNNNITGLTELALLTGHIIDSHVVDGTILMSTYGVTYSYEYNYPSDPHHDAVLSPSTSFQRTRHYIKIPRSVDDFGPPPHRPFDLNPGTPLQLVMIPGRPESALPLETWKALRKYMGNSRIAVDGVYGCVHVRSFQMSHSYRCADFLVQFFCWAWWFPFTCSAALFYIVNERNAYLNQVDVVVFWMPLLLAVWYLLGLPVCYWQEKRLRNNILSGGDALQSA